MVKLAQWKAGSDISGGYWVDFENGGGVIEEDEVEVIKKAPVREMTQGPIQLRVPPRHVFFLHRSGQKQLDAARMEATVILSEVAAVALHFIGGIGRKEANG